MIVFFGVRPYGTIDRCDRVSTVTQFLHAFLVPLVPLGSAIVVRDELGAIVRTHPIPLSLRSVVAGYLRFTAPAGAVAIVASWWGAWWIFLHRRGPGPMVAALLVASLLAWTLLGRTSRDEAARRRIYARVLGDAIDPAKVGDAREALRERLRARFDALALPAAGAGYREGSTDWTAAVLASEDDEVLAVGATRARLEASLASGDAKTALEAAHDAMLARLTASRTTSP